jgi:hypothetical protein
MISEIRTPNSRKRKQEDRNVSGWNLTSLNTYTRILSAVWIILTADKDWDGIQQLTRRWEYTGNGIRYAHRCKQAGFLAHGSSYWPHLPRPNMRCTFFVLNSMASDLTQWLQADYEGDLWLWRVPQIISKRRSSPNTAMAGLRWTLTIFPFNVV